MSSGTDYATQIVLARALGLRYQELKQQQEVVIANERDENVRRMRRVKLDDRLKGFDEAALAVILDNTAREHYRGHKAGNSR